MIEIFRTDVCAVANKQVLAACHMDELHGLGDVQASLEQTIPTLPSLIRQGRFRCVLGAGQVLSHRRISIPDNP